MEPIMTVALLAQSQTLQTSASQAGGSLRRDAAAVNADTDTPSENSEIRDSLSATLEALRNAPETARQAAQNRARERVEAVREQLKLVKALYAENPEGMAKALRHLVKELNTALKAYKDAGGDAAQLSGGLTRAPAPASAQTTASDATVAPADPERSEGDATPADPAQEPTAPVKDHPAPVIEPGRYDTLAPAAPAPSREGLEARKGGLKGDEDFVNKVDGLTRKIRELFETAKIKAAFQARDSDRADAFEALEDDLGELEDDVFDYKRDVQDALISVDLQTKLLERSPSATSALAITV
jgi:beta-glucosidase-like glycosyl hydrolase